MHRPRNSEALTLAGALGIGQARVISVCGAGGKTSLIFALAHAFAEAGERVLVTTTTKLARKEAEGPLPWCHAANAREVLAWAESRFAEAGGAPPPLVAVSGPDASGEKCVGFGPEVIDEIADARLFTRLLIEADGSRKCPLKTSAPHEPVIASRTDATIFVVGLNGIGEPLDEAHVFRPALWSERTGQTVGEAVTAEAVAAILAHEMARIRGRAESESTAVFLNQAEGPAREEAARRIAEALGSADPPGLGRIVTGSLRPSPRIVHVVSLADERYKAADPAR